MILSHKAVEISLYFQITFLSINLNCGTSGGAFVGDLNDLISLGSFVNVDSKYLRGKR
jgi:hypothetical protein